MSLPNLNTGTEITNNHDTDRIGNVPRRSTYFFDLGSDALSPKCRRKYQSASPLGSPDSPLTSSDSETLQADSPTIRLLDPAHRPSPRAVQALRREHPPLVVISDDHHRLGSPASRPAWRNLRSASSIESFTSRFSHMTLPLTSTPYRGSYDEIGGSSFRRRCCVRRVGFAVVTVTVALIVTAVPSVFVSRKLVEAESDDLFALFRERPEIAIPTWLGTCFFLLAILSALFSFIRFLRRKYLERRASYEEAVQFARETMPEYGLRVPTNHSSLGYFYLNRNRPNVRLAPL